MQKRGMKVLNIIIILMLIIELSFAYIIPGLLSLMKYDVAVEKHEVKNEKLLATELINTPSNNASYFTKPIIGSTVWPIVTIYTYSDSSCTNKTGTINALTECVVTDVNGYNFKIKYIKTSGKTWKNAGNSDFAQTWVDANKLLINLPDVRPDIVYSIRNATNAQDIDTTSTGSIFKVGSGNSYVSIPDITGKMLYTYDNSDGKQDGKVYNSKIGKLEFVCPLIYPFAEQVAYAQNMAKQRGYNLKIYDGYRPKDVCDKFTNKYNSAIPDNSTYLTGWGKGWFVAQGISDHSCGTAIDVTLENGSGELQTQSDMHDLSVNSTTVPSTGYITNRREAHNKSVMNQNAKILYEIMVEDAGMGNLASEWWHFNMNLNSTVYGNISYDARKNSLYGETSVTYTDKTAFSANIAYSPESPNKSKTVTVTITATKNISAIEGSSGWTINNSNKKIATKTYNTNKEENITIKSVDGNSLSKKITVTNVDNKVDIKSTAYNPMQEEKTNGSVTVTVTANENLNRIEDSSVNWNVNGKTATAQYNNNKTETIKVYDEYDNSKQIEIKVTNIDKTAPEILKVQYCIDNSNQEWVLITGNEPIEITDCGNADNYHSNITQSLINSMKIFNPMLDDSIDLNNSVVLMYQKNYPTDTIKIADEAGNEITYNNFEVVLIDDQGPEVEVIYQTDGNTYDNTNYSTNKDVTVIVTSNEEIGEITGWESSNDKKTLTKTYLASEFPSGTRETIEVKDNKFNKTQKVIRVKIDTNAPYVTSPKEEVTSHNGTLTVNVSFNEACTIVSGDGWAKPASGGPNMISKTFTGATSEEGESIIVKDAAGNECEFGIRVRNDNGMLAAEIFDTTPPILEKIIYGTTTPTNMNVRVTLIVNEKIQEVEGWDLQEGTGEYENKWILTRLYSGNIEENVEIFDIDGNKIVGNNITNNNVTDGKVKIKITNIDKEAPQINDNYEIVPESGTNNVVVTLTANEEVSVKEGENWRISNSGNGVGTKITGTMQKGTTDIIKIADRAGNTAYFKVTCNDAGTNVTVNTGALVSISKSPKRKTNSDVTVGITVNKKIGKINNKNISNGETVDGWKLTENIQGNSNSGYISKAFTENGEYEVQIEDIDGNKVIGEDIIDGVVRFSIDNIEDSTEIKDIESIEIEQLPKNVYYQGDLLDLSELVVKINYVDGSSESIEYSENSDFEFSKNGSSIRNNAILTEIGPRQIISVIYGDESAWFYIMVNELKVDNLLAKTDQMKTNYVVGETLNTEGLSLEVTYNSGKTETITTGFTVEEISLDSAGTKWVNVTFQGKTTSFKITVSEQTEKTVKRIQIRKWSGRYVEYIEGENLDLQDLEIKVIYSDNSSEDISYVDGSEGIVVTPIKLETVGEPIITITYGGKSINVRVTVIEKSLTELNIINEPTKKTYNIGESIDLTGIKLEAKYDNGLVEEINDTQLEEYGITCSPNTVSSSGTQYIAVCYKQLRTVFEINVNEKEITNIEVIKKVERNYYKGERIDLSNFEILVTYNGNSHETIQNGFWIEPDIVSINSGEQELTVHYKNKTAQTSVNVIVSSIQGITVISRPLKTTYVLGEIFNREDLYGLVVEATYEGGRKQQINIDDLVIDDIKFDEIGSKTINISYQGKPANFQVDVRKLQINITGINKLPNKTQYEIGDNLEIAGLELNVINEYGNNIIIDASVYEDITYSPKKLNTSGTQTITVQYGNDRVTFDVEVRNKDSENPSDGGDENPSDGGDENPSDGGDENPSDGENENPSDGGNENPSDEENKNPSDEGNENPSDGENKNKNEDESNKNNSNNNQENKNSDRKDNRGNQNNEENSKLDNKENTKKDDTVAPSGYKDTNTAKSRLPQTGISQIIVGVLVISAIVSGTLFIKYRKM